MTRQPPDPVTVRAVSRSGVLVDRYFRYTRSPDGTIVAVAMFLGVAVGTALAVLFATLTIGALTVLPVRGALGRGRGSQ